MPNVAVQGQRGGGHTKRADMDAHPMIPLYFPPRVLGCNAAAPSIVSLDLSNVSKDERLWSGLIQLGTGSPEHFTTDDLSLGARQSFSLLGARVVNSRCNASHQSQGVWPMAGSALMRFSASRGKRALLVTTGYRCVYSEFTLHTLLRRFVLESQGP